MWEAIRHRFELAKDMFRSRWFRWMAITWAVIGTWDTFISQMLPDKVAANAPRVHKIIFGLLDMTSGWVSLWGWLLIGAGLIVVSSIEFSFRIVREEKIRQRYFYPVNSEKDKLDYLVDGIQAVNDITQAMNVSNRETVHIGKRLNQYAMVMPFVANLKLRRWFLSKAATDISSYSAKVQKTAEFIKAATPAVRENQIQFINGMDCYIENEQADLKAYIETIRATSEKIIPSTVKSFEDMQIASGAIRGITGELNAASSQVHVAIGVLIQRIKEFGTACDQIRAVATDKIASAETI